MTEAPDPIWAYTTDVARRQAAAIEEACELALQGGEFGVLVRTHLDDNGWHLIAEVSPLVPYGTIGVAPSETMEE